MKGYSTRDVAEMLELTPETIREIARSGIIEPARSDNQQYRFSFQDIIILRTAKELLSSGVRKSRINRALFKLKRQMPTNKPLTSLRISGDGNDVLIKDEDKVYSAETG